jgi:photosystem II stability/assembly factor-like uncharacterized protein
LSLIVNFRRKLVVLGGALAFGWILVWVLVRLVSAEFTSGSNHSFFFPAVFQEFTALEWAEVGPPNVDIATFEIDPNRPETIYAGTTEYQGVWRSQDGGQSWEVMGNGFPFTVTVRHLAVAPVSPTVIYAGVRGSFLHQIYRSFDGGDSWQGLARIHDYPLTTLAVNPVTSTTVYAGVSTWDSPTTGGEVFRSLDGGSNWSQILPLGTLAQIIVVDPVKPQVVYVGRLSGGLLKSVDGGDNWQAINNGLPSNVMTIRNVLLHPSNSQIVYITTNDGLFRSLDGGENWASFGLGLPVPWLSSLAFVPNSPETLFATPVEGDDSYGVYKSIDSGNMWQRLAPNPVDAIPKEIRVQVGASTNLFVLFDGYGSEDGRFWKLSLISPGIKFLF